MTKICRKCEEELPLTEFYKNDKYKDGYLNTCRKCSYTYKRKLKPVIDEKPCNKCGITKDLTKFYKNKKGRGGVLSICIECFKAQKNAKYVPISNRKRSTAKSKKKPTQKSNSVEPKVDGRRGEYYVNNYDLHYEMVVSKAQGRLTRDAHKMILLIISGVLRKFRYNNPEDRQDVKGYMIMNLLDNWYNYNPDITTNAFAYLTELAKRSAAAGWKLIYKTKGDEEAVVLSLDFSVDGSDPWVNI